MATQAIERPSVRFSMRCWGDFGLLNAQGDDVRPRGRKTRALLAYLALRPDKAVSREKLAGLLWGDRGEEQARASLRQALFELKEFTNGAGLLSVDRECVTLAGSALQTDLDVIAGLVEAGEADALLAVLPEPDDVLLANLDGVDPGFDDWLRVERTRQRDVLAALVADASATALATGQTRTARALHARLGEFAPGPSPDVAAAPVASIVPPPSPSPVRKRRHVEAAAALLLVAAGVGTAAWLTQTANAAASDTQVRSLYEPAHAIVYERRGREYPVAANLLRRAVAIDPGHAPAAIDLAAVSAMMARTPAQWIEAERLARKAVALDPRSGLAHGVLGMVLRFESAEARAAIKKAATLDARDPQVQFWLSNVQGVEGNYTGRLQSLRRAIALDPRLYRATGTVAMAAWELGHVREAELHAARLRDMDLNASFFCAYALDFFRGHYADTITNILAVRDRLTAADAADWKLGVAYLVLGHDRPARLLTRLPPHLWRVASGAGPQPGDLETILIEADRDDRAQFYVGTAVRQVLKAGRAREIVAAYDQRVGVMAALKSDDVSIDLPILYGVDVAQALIAVGRKEEGAVMLARGNAAIRKSLSFGDMPNWMYAGAAGVWAAQGRTEAALGALETAVRRGWHYAPMTPMPDMADNPPFASLVGHPRFERLRRQERAHLERERRKLGKILV